MADVIDGEEKKFVSVGMPVRNGGEFVEKTLKSLLAQDYQYVQIVISDNNSTDDTESICAKFTEEHENIEYYRSDVDLPAIDNFNRALQKATGEYFMWAAHDDLWDPNYISTLVELLERNDTVAIAAGNIVGINRDDKEIWDCPWTWELPSSNRLLRLIKYIAQSDYHRKPVLVYGLMRRSAINAIGGFRERGGFVQGVALYTVFSLLMSGDIQLTRETTFYKRKTGRKYFSQQDGNVGKKGRFWLVGKMSTPMDLIDYVRRHSFMRYLDGYREVARVTDNLSLSEKGVILVFLFFWRIWLGFRLLKKEILFALRLKRSGDIA